MKPNPLMIIGAIFAASFLGRAVGIANASLNKDETQKSAEMGHHDDAMAALAKEAAGAPTVLGSQPADHDDHSDGEHHAETKMAAASTAQSADAPNSLASAVDQSFARTPASASQKANQYSELLSAIRDRAALIDQREAAVEDRIRILEILETRIETKLAELRKSNDDLSTLVSYANEASQKDIALLAKMYEQMKPKKAGEIFDKMNPTFAAGFLTEMNSESAALILTNMSTDQAYETSMIIASRNAAVHQQ